MSSAISVANALIRMAGENGHYYTKLELMKLVYMAHGYVLARFNKSLIDEPVQAWEHGPVFHSLYQKTKNYKNIPIKTPFDDTIENFNSDEEQILSLTTLKHGEKNSKHLYANNHAKSTPWAKLYQPKKILLYQIQRHC